jgi:hypothetical protein
MRSGKRIGQELTSLENINKKMVVELITFKTEIIKLFTPLARYIGDQLVLILKAVNVGIKTINFFVESITKQVDLGIKLISFIPGIGKAIKAIYDNMMNKNISDAQQDSLNRQVDFIFSEEGSGLPGRKNGVSKSFLPSQIGKP